MTSQDAESISVPTNTTDDFQTKPVEPSRRLPKSAISIELCTPADAEKIAEGLYICFPEAWWAKKEPPELRPTGPNSVEIRIQRLAARLTPALTDPHHCFTKAVLTSTGQTVGIAGWTLPTNPSIHSLFRRSALTHYAWQTRMSWSDAQVDEMWSHVSNENWSERFAKDDETRREAVGGAPHWYLAPLLTWPKWQGRGVGKRLMDWAMSQADETGTVMYLEARPSARGVYEHLGFVGTVEMGMVRRARGDVEGEGGEKVGNGELDGEADATR